MVAVIGKTGIRLMPTSNYRARKLLARKKAVIYKHRPFTIQLTEREDGDTQPIEYAIDTGYYHVGNSVKTAKHEFAAVELRTLMDEKLRHEDRCRYRKQRRSHLRYRKPRFNNRNHDRDTENLHLYRGEKISKGRRSIRQNRYPYQPHDQVVYQGETVETSGCHNKGTRLLIAKKSVAVTKVHLKRYCGGYFAVTV